MEPIHTEKHGAYSIKIFQDLDAPNPREEFDHLGTIYHVHPEYDLGQRVDSEEIKSIIEDNEFMTLPVFLYDHSGICLNTSGYSCPWDSGQVGIIAVKKSKVLAEFGETKWTDALESQVRQTLKAEVAEFSDYLSGNVYGFVIEKDNECKTCGHHEPEHIDSCWGFIGDYEHCLKEARSNLPEVA